MPEQDEDWVPTKEEALRMFASVLDDLRDIQDCDLDHMDAQSAGLELAKLTHGVELLHYGVRCWSEKTWPDVAPEDVNSHHELVTISAVEAAGYYAGMILTAGSGDERWTYLFDDGLDWLQMALSHINSVLEGKHIPRSKPRETRTKALPSTAGKSDA